MVKPAARVQVTGAKELRRALKHMGADASDLTRTNKAATETVAAAARQRAPVGETHRLVHSIQAKATRTTGRVEAGKGILYGGVIHFGWPRHNIAPQPFIFDALDERKDEVVADYERRIAELVVRVGAETP